MGDIPHITSGSPGSDLRFIADRLAERVLRLDQALTRLTGDDPDSEAVHDVRVSSRRLVGALDACRDEIGRRKRVKRIRRDLQKLRRGLGAAREAEVGRDTLEAMGRGASKEEEILTGFLAAELFREIRARAGDNEAAGDLRPDRRLEAVRNLVTRLLEESLRSRQGAPEKQIGELRNRALDRLRAGRSALLDLPREPLTGGDDRALHEFRIAGKKLRYTMEFYESLFPARLASRMRLLKRVQDCLGEAHDLADFRRRILDMASGMKSPEHAAARDACLRLAARVEDRRRKTLKPLFGFIRAIEHPGFLPAPGAASEKSAGVPAAEEPSPDSPEVSGPAATHAPPHLRIINAGGDDGRKKDDE